MNTKLNHVQNWPELACEVKWSANRLAKKCGVSVRTLERHFFKQMGKKPKAWLIEQRQKLAMELLHDGCSVKEAASQLGFAYAHHFSREFKGYWGNCPTTVMASGRPASPGWRALV